MIDKVYIDNLDRDTTDMIVYEGIIRRLAATNAPFLLKGSLLTRQYLKEPSIRKAADIDLLYLEKIDSPEDANEIFTNWMVKITEFEMEDGIEFISFKENAFFRMIDYAMDDDFPTVNTDIGYNFSFNKTKATFSEIDLDISFNLNIGIPPVALTYVPIIGEKFLVPYTVPLSIQIAWKLHQTIVRPRFKDLYDIKLLLQNPSYNEEALKETMRALYQECKHDKAVNNHMVKKIFTDEIYNIYDSFSNRYDYEWRIFSGSNNNKAYFLQFIQELKDVMNSVKLNEDTYKEYFLVQ